MATQQGIIQFSGKVGNLVGTRSKSGKYHLRSHYQVPKEVWETAPNYEPNRKAASIFGEASTFVTHIRNGLQPYLEWMADGRLHNRLQALAVRGITHCRSLDPSATLDARRLAPLFRGFSLRTDLTLKRVVSASPECKQDPEGGRVLHLEGARLSAGMREKVKVDILRWHIALVPLPVDGMDPSQYPPTYQQSDWMRPQDLCGIDFPIQLPAGSPPVLIAVGIESAQGDAGFPYPLRTLSVMEIVDIL